MIRTLPGYEWQEIAKIVEDQHDYIERGQVWRKRGYVVTPG